MFCKEENYFFLSFITCSHRRSSGQFHELLFNHCKGKLTDWLTVHPWTLLYSLIPVGLLYLIAFTRSREFFHCYYYVPITAMMGSVESPWTAGG